MVTPAELYREFEKIDLQFIRDCHEDNGLLRKYIEKCTDDYQRQFAENLIRVNEIEIENAMEDVKYDRQTAAELERLQRGGSGDIIPGDEIDVGSAEGFSYQHQESNPFP